MVKKEAEEISQMLSFGSSESYVIQEQPLKNTRTPEQSKYHVLAERNRRTKLSKKFLALSALLPRLKKGDRGSVLEEAISHMKRLEKRLKVLEKEKAMAKTEAPACVCLCYHYEEKSTPLKKMEIRVQKEDVLIKINLENSTGFRKDKFTREMNKLHLSVTKIMLLPFGDNMLAVSAAAKMNAEFCKTEEEVANSIRLAILKLMV